jgi:dethiobiotin synthetase
MQDQGLTVAGMKPVASGCAQTANGLRNEDAVLLQQQSSMPLDYALVNPYAFEPAIAPHLAAQAAGVQIELETIGAAYAELAAQVDCVVVEGVGGWLVPLNERDCVADLARMLGLNVCMVVGMRLGCLNHALLTATSIEAAGCTLAGWVANRLPPAMECAQENINTLKAKLSSPRFGTVPVLGEIDVKIVAQNLSIPS